jgi:hypothetical protein
LLEIKGYEVFRVDSVRDRRDRVNNMDARSFDGANVESIGIQKMDNEYAENISVIQLGRSRNTGQAAEKLAKAGGTRLRRVICGKELEQSVAHAWFLFIDDGIAGGTNQLCLAKTSYTCRMNDLAKGWIQIFPLEFLP